MPTRSGLVESPSFLSALAAALSPGGAARRSRLWAGASRLLLGAALVSLSSCGGDDPVFTTLFTTKHFVYHVEAGTTPPCNGTDQWLERYYSANATFLGATLPPGERIDYYFTGSAESLGCPAEATGCFSDATIHSLSPISAHEIVHANAASLGEPPALFQEGLAELLSCSSTVDIAGPLDTSAPIEQLVETDDFTDWREKDGFGLYTASRSFVGFLIDKLGASRFLSFYARAPHGGSRQKIDTIFQAELGVSLDDAFSEWRTSPPLFIGDMCLRLMECDPSMPALDDTGVTLGCGPLGIDSPQGTIRRFEVPNDRVIRITTEPIHTAPPVLSNVSFYRCSGGDAVGIPVHTSGYHANADHNLDIDPAQPGSAFALDVPPGEYVAWFQGNGGPEAPIGISVEARRSPMRNSGCQAAEEPLALDDKLVTTLASRWIERPCQGPWCPGQSWDVSIGATGGALEALALVWNSKADFSPGELYICTDPCPVDTSHCEVLELDTAKASPIRSKQTFEPGTVLHLGAPTAPLEGYFAVQLRVAPQK
jgi:hypothetical protein